MLEEHNHCRVIILRLDAGFNRKLQKRKTVIAIH